MQLKKINVNNYVTKPYQNDEEKMTTLAKIILTNFIIYDDKVCVDCNTQFTSDVIQKFVFLCNGQSTLLFIINYYLKIEIWSNKFYI